MSTKYYRKRSGRNFAMNIVLNPLTRNIALNWNISSLCVFDVWHCKYRD